MLRNAPRAKWPLPEICAVTTSPGAVRGANTTRPLVLPTPSPPAAIESIATLTTAISCADHRAAPPASTNPRRRCFRLRDDPLLRPAPTRHARTDPAPRATLPPSPRLVHIRL